METHDAATEKSRRERRWKRGCGMDSQLVTPWLWRRAGESRGSPSFRAVTERNPAEARWKGKMQS